MYKVFRARGIVHIVLYGIEIELRVPNLEHTFFKELLEGK